LGVGPTAPRARVRRAEEQRKGRDVGPTALRVPPKRRQEPRPGVGPKDLRARDLWFRHFRPHRRRAAGRRRGHPRLRYLGLRPWYVSQRHPSPRPQRLRGWGGGGGVCHA
jgi:hypothetical protein